MNLTKAHKKRNVKGLNNKPFSFLMHCLCVVELSNLFGRARKLGLKNSHMIISLDIKISIEIVQFCHVSGAKEMCGRICTKYICFGAQRTSLSPAIGNLTRSIRRTECLQQFASPRVLLSTNRAKLGRRLCQTKTGAV